MLPHPHEYVKPYKTAPTIPPTTHAQYTVSKYVCFVLFTRENLTFKFWTSQALLKFSLEDDWTTMNPEYKLQSNFPTPF